MEKSQFLQVMRFVAAALVLCTHATFYYHERVGSWLPVWHFGEVGVPIFFVISGIVMVASTQGMPLDGQGAKAFMLRRIIRIVPLWWLALGVKVAMALARPDVVNHNHFQPDYAVKSFLFIPYFNEAHAVVPLHGVGWTLLHEMFFYVLFSLSMLMGRKPAWASSLVIVSLWLAGRWFELDNAMWAVASSPANLQFVLGMAVGSMLVASPSRGWRWGFAAALAATALVALAMRQSWGTHHGVVVVLLFGAATLCCAQLRLPRAFTPAVKLGDSSYSLYLFHPFAAPAFILLLNALLPRLHVALHLGLAIAATIAVCHLIHLFVEVPAVRVARRQLIGRFESGEQRLSSAS